ncbi:hypothetical protein [Duffyella gerundensis]|uniref:hypothetical protein n=1 Tax=Duffyella TaxID=3026546 RepID=UPI003F6DFF16
MNPDEEQSRSYPLQEDMRWQRREWRLQKVGVVMLFLIVIAGACGLFSRGFLSEQQVRSGDRQLQVEYERFGRQLSTMNMAIRLQQLEGERFTLRIDRGAIDNFQLQTVQPQPLIARSQGHDLLLTWALPAQQHNASVWLTWQPLGFGHFHSTVSLEHGATVAFSQLIYP